MIQYIKKYIYILTQDKNKSSFQLTSLVNEMPVDFQKFLSSIIKIEKLESTEGETIVFDHVLMIGDAKKSTVGAPIIVGAKVEALKNSDSASIPSSFCIKAQHALSSSIALTSATLSLICDRNCPADAPTSSRLVLAFR